MGVLTVSMEESEPASSWEVAGDFDGDSMSLSRKGVSANRSSPLPTILATKLLLMKLGAFAFVVEILLLIPSIPMPSISNTSAYAFPEHPFVAELLPKFTAANFLLMMPCSVSSSIRLCPC